jgi:hypothetical protein
LLLLSYQTSDGVQQCLLIERALDDIRIRADGHPAFAVLRRIE